MPLADPWAEIEPTDSLGALRARRVDRNHMHDFYWGRDASSHRLLIYQSADDVKLPSPLPRIKGIALDFSDNQFTIRLLQGSDFDIFKSLCWSLIERTRQAKSSGEVLGIMISQLQRWQRFLSKARIDLLTDEEIRGLFCELHFLESELIPRFGSQSIRLWKGPSGAPQDFAVGNLLLEVKSHLAGAAPIIYISSADQLWGQAATFFLVAYSIAEATESTPGAKSLAERIKRIRVRLEASLDLELFEDCLLQVGYLDHPEYDRQFFTTARPDSYGVKGAFPRITSDLIPAGVCRLHYGIELAACLRFKEELPWPAPIVKHDS